jgi:hypothetical protein
MPREPADLIAGRHPVAEALRAGVAVHHLYLAEGMRPSPLLDEIVEAARRRRIPIDFETRSSLDRRLSVGAAGGPGGRHQGSSPRWRPTGMPPWPSSSSPGPAGW